MDKLGERLAFEHAGARLYEALLAKHRAYGSFDGGPSADDLVAVPRGHRVAELADDECWTALAQLAQQDGHENLANRCREATGHERDHLRKVRTWIATGQGRTVADADGAEMPEVMEGEEFTFAADSPVDREGYAVSEEERAEGGDSDAQGSQTSRSSKARSPRRRR